MKRKKCPLNYCDFIAFCLATFVLVAPALAQAAPKAICVPWLSAYPSVPHSTYIGAQTTVKGIARDATEYRWDFGDGQTTAWAPITDPYNLGVEHTYNGAIRQLFNAVLSVRNAAGEESQDEYLIRIEESSDLSNPIHLNVRINMAIDEGLWYLHTNMIRSTYAGGSPGYGQPYGYWDPNYYPLAASGTAVDAFLMHGTKAHMDIDNDPYVETVQRALNYILANTYAYNISPQPYGDPDVNGNGIGLVCNQTSNLYDSRQTYIGGITMTALASSGSPNRIAPCGGDYVYGRRMADILQDMADFWAWGQVDSGTGRGGWRYYANYYNSDMSTTQWPPLAMIAAQQNMGVEVPDFVYTELVRFLDYTQNMAQDNDNGAFGYSVPNEMNNITKAAAGIICHEFLGTPLTDPRVMAAIGYIYRHWNDTGNSWDDTQLLGNSYGMYGVMKAFRIPEPDIFRVVEYDYVNGSQTANNFDWYYTPAGQSNRGIASYNVATQQADGSWDDIVGANPVYNAFATGWRVLTLLKGVGIVPPTAVTCDCDEQEYNLNQTVNLDGACSYHQDQNRHIVDYSWDFDCDGTADVDGPQATILGGFPATGLYPVCLTVTDDNPEVPQTDTYQCVVDVHPPPHCPHAFAGGPYLGWVNVALHFNGGASWDPDNEIASYEWDMDNDGLFGAEDDDCFGQSSDAVGLNPEWTWDAPYAGVVGLRVTDEEGEFEPCSDVDYVQVEIGNHAPVADPGEPYSATTDSCITLDGTYSHDIDPDDSITFSWDLDNDGVFGDCVEAECEFCVEDDFGTVYDVCLRVEDTFGEYAIACTTVEVVEDLPPEAVCQDLILDADASCVACGSIDDGSSDPDGPPWEIALDPDCAYSLGTTEVTLTITDPHGFTDSCTGTVTVVDDTQPALTCPPDQVNQCTGNGGAIVDPGDATASDNCSLVSLTDPGPGSYALGITPVTYTAVDGSSNSNSCVTQVEVIDTVPPEIICPPDLNVECMADEMATADPGDASASDVCTNATVVDDRIGGYPLGNTTVTYTATDGSNNQNACFTEVSVVDTTAPVAACIGDVQECTGVLTPVSTSCTGEDICDPTLSMYSDANAAYPLGNHGFTCNATDGSGNQDSVGCDVVIVDTSAPVLSSITTVTDPVAINTKVEAYADFTDACGPHSGTWDWGDGTTTAVDIDEGPNGLAYGNHTYTTPGVYTVTLTVTDASGNASQSVYHYVVVYNSCGGFVTGSGWIHSPAGAYVEKPYLSGIATFGFTSDYLPGAKVPTGITTFQFLLGGLYFKSTSYEWLVVAGPNAKYKGEGKINFHGNYGFMLTATDGQARGGGGVDTFRIKIWDKDNNDAVVYDNQMGESDDSNAGTALTLGSIIVFR